MDQYPNHRPESCNPPEPRWPAMVALLAVGALYWALPGYLVAGPRWLLLTIVAGLLLPAVIAHEAGHTGINVLLGHLLGAVMTVFLLWSLVLLVRALPERKEQPLDLLRSAALLWSSNVLVFASWYWRLDAGGPHQRAKRLGHPTGAFLFPQMTAEERHAREKDGLPWSPKFVDYLFLAFNTSTALSPTDSPVISRWAKAMMMLQSLISITIVVILVARAMNTL